METLKNAIIANGYQFPETEVKAWLASNGGSSGIVQTKHYGKIYFYIIKPWNFCPAGKVVVERA